MALTVIKTGEVILNDVRYKIGGDGNIHPFIASRFAQKQVIGDYSLDSDPDRSFWVVVGDQSGGIGVDQLIMEKYANRSWWTDCNVEYPGHCFIRKPDTALALDSYPGYLLNRGFEDWTAGAPDSWTETDAGGLLTVTEDTANEDTGDSCLKMVVAHGTAIGSSYMTQSFTGATWSNSYRGKTVILTFRVKGSATGTANAQFRVSIYDGIGTTNGSAVQSDTSYASCTVTRVIDAAATELTVRLEPYNNTGSPITYYWDTGYLKAPYTGTIKKWVEFNGNLYLISGYILWKLNATGNGWTLVTFFKDTITDAVASVNDCLYIFLGDSVSYQYMSTAEAFTEAVGSDGGGTGDSSAATLAVHWANKLFKITSAGQISHSATPNSATPTWTNNGLLDTKSFGTINGLITYADSSGSDIIYAGVTTGLMAHSYGNGSTTGAWTNTELKVPLHADNGKGMVVQNGALYYSAGLSVCEYSLTSSGLSVRNIGLDADDGLPEEFSGSITSLIGGYSGTIYALVDASLVSGASSSVYKYNGRGWVSVWFVGASNAMPAGFVSSVYDYRLWFANTTAPTYIALDRSRRNPLKKTGSTYDTGAYYYSPWFDAGWPTGNKLALQTRAYVKNTTANITAAISYKLNKTDLTLDSNLTAHATLAAAAAGTETATSFGSSLGTLFKSIMFKIVLTTNDSAVTPDLIYFTLEYEKVMTPKWGWTFIIDSSETYGEKTTAQQFAALKTAVETSTLVSFYHSDTAKYVRIRDIDVVQSTGAIATGQWKVTVVEK